MIYFDNTSTTWPKPACVQEAMVEFMQKTGANPGRAAHRLANDAARIVYRTRENISVLFNNPDPLRVVFTSNATEALNLALKGILRHGDHVITSSMEHNSMMRPLRELESSGVEVTTVPCSSLGYCSPDVIKNAIRKNTKMIALNHASNVNGIVQPVFETGQLAREHGLLFLVDTAQSAGVIDIDMKRDYIDLLAFTGHKSLYGPMGTGGLIFGERVDVKAFKPLRQGGTGSRSREELQPDFLPDMCESGTLNVIGLAGLNAAVEWLQQTQLQTLYEHSFLLMEKFISGVEGCSAIKLFYPETEVKRTPTLSFFHHSISVAEIGQTLDEEYSILCRVGLHCSPVAHKTIGTFPSGTIRFGFGYFNTIDEINTAIAAIKEL